ncbi:MAG: CRISPR-associated protein Cas5 [Porticoccaceae bacterium]
MRAHRPTRSTPTPPGVQGALVAATGQI